MSSAVSEKRIISGTGRDICDVIAEGVAEATGINKNDVGPLYDVIDGDCLERLFRDKHAPSNTKLTFPFETCKITIFGTQEVMIEPLPEDN